MIRALTMVIALSGLVCPIWAEDPSRTDTDRSAAEILAGTVSGEPVSVAEHARILRGKRAGVYHHFKTKYGVDDHAEFWWTSYEGERPADILHQEALRELARVKVQQILARERGVIGDIRYSTFLRDLERENERRREAVAHGRVIYGPQQYTPEQFFGLMFGNMVHELKLRLEKELADSVTDDDLVQEYSANRERLKKSAVLRLEKWARPFRPSKDVEKQHAAAAVRRIRESLARGVAPSLDATGERSEPIIDGKTSRYYSLQEPILFAAAQRLEAGQISDILEENNACFVLRCLERSEEEYVSFDAARPKLLQNLVARKYEAMIDELAAGAKIEMDYAKLASIDLR